MWIGTGRRNETPLETDDGPREIAAKPEAEASPYAGRMAAAVSRTLSGIGAEDRFLLASYFLDRRTLKEVARMVRVHEATVSRRIGRLTEELRKQLLRNLQAGGLSRRAAEEALGTDPRDVEVNLRVILQGSQTKTFQEQRGSE
jgi:RNA polymerase sigma-70 factor (ECF subfamily)